MRSLVTRPGATPLLIDVEPAPVGPAGLRIEVAAAAVNASDVFLATDLGRATFGVPERAGLGMDVSGTVTEVGQEVTGFAVGDRVAAMHHDFTAPSRTHAESVVVPAAHAAPVPDGLDLIAAGSIPLNALTARQGLDLLGPADGRSLLITGAAGGVGGYATEMAAREGWRVSGLARSGDADVVRDAGAVELLTTIQAGRFDALFDAAALQGDAIGAVRDGGAFVGVQPPTPVAPERGIEPVDVFIQPDAERLAELLALHLDGTLTARVAGQVALAEAETAYAKVAGGGQRGRWLIVP
ncbi:alcohol dehydrogenase catalytic domain-containing protein [Myceligenerans indicum]|uniref:Alcohol dehydrogenase catalytic domain-containing protein n=1 Tax=Myceligenerans indicum TaxID=2593663 RepID=A0ABS1LIV5_9MICO|nr:alcohol dehydrogenase catalytic domain-containing protein [Myceligenerans indicum]MBL0885969.1 alcohol dehydrogenase catalytic domain-containing protein [Myceligenerans indicum]